MTEVYSFSSGVKKGNSFPRSFFHLSWVDVNNPSPQELKEIQKSLSLHSFTIDDCSLRKSRPKLESDNDTVSLIFYSLGQDFSFHELCFLLHKQTIFSFHKKKIDSFESLKKNKERLESLLQGSHELLLHHLLQGMSESYFRLLEELENKLDVLEKQALKKPEAHVLEELFGIKRKVLKLRKIIYPQREAVNKIGVEFRKQFSPSSLVYFRDMHNDLLVVTDIVEDLRETISSILEVHLSVTSNKLNEVMKVLTGISTVLLPLTLIASIYGMNFYFMPELTWKYGYFFTLGFMALILVFTLFYF